MSSHFHIQSSDPALLVKATQIAETFARQYVRAGIVGIAFLGAIARGYFDTFADIDIAIFKEPNVDISLAENYVHDQGFEIHCFLSDYAQEVDLPWDMPKRWAFSSHQIYYDPHGLLSTLLQMKIPLQPEERKWLMIEGMAQSNWCIDTLTQVWVARGNLMSAQHMFDEGITYFLNALYGLNNELVADFKWRYYCAEQLAVLPPQFHHYIREVFCVHSITEADIERRRLAFMEMWQTVLPLVEAEVHMPFDEFSKLV